MDYNVNVNKLYLPLLKNQDRLLFLWGGRNAGRSVFAAQKVLLRCLSEKYFRCLIIKKTYESIRDSQFATLKDVAFQMGLDQYFKFTENPFRISCILNNNLIIAKGLDTPQKIKSTKDPSAVWYEEANEMTFEDWLVVTTTIRSLNANYIQEIFTFNPETKENFENFWIYKIFFDGHPEQTFRNKVSINVTEKEKYEYYYTAQHATYKDNFFIDDKQIANLEQLKDINPYYYNIYTLGNWGNRDTADRFWKDFDNTKHVAHRKIDLELPLLITFDENVSPYPALSIWQEKDKKLRQIHEICLRTPRNKLIEVAKEFVKWARTKNFNNIVFIYGDVTSDREDTKLAKGYNYFTMLQKEISQAFSCRIKKSDRNPPVALSAEFINSIFGANYDGWSIVIDPSCKESINDYRMVQEASDGSMKKPKKDGIELLGHFSDALRYLISEYCSLSFEKYKRRLDKANDYIYDKLPDRRY